MHKRSLATACALGAAALFGVPSAQAVVLLSLVDPPEQFGTPYEVAFQATAATTPISIAGYQVAAYEYVSDISVALGGGANLLGGAWTFTPAPEGSDAGRVSDGTSVPALWFGGYSPGNFDVFSQTVATVPGEQYLLKFDFANDSSSGGSGLLVTATPSVASLSVPSLTNSTLVPEPSTWTMMLSGFLLLGFTGYRRARKAQTLNPFTSFR